MNRGSARRAALLLMGGAALIGAGCGSNSQATETDLRVQREDLVVAAQALRSAGVSVQREARASRAAWPSVVNGLPAPAGARTRKLIGEAAMQAAALRLPPAFSEERSRALTGPASGLAGTYRSFTILAGRGWRQISYMLAQLERGPPASASFAKKNVALYIESVYDGHFAAAQIGKHLLAGYEHLGGAAAFGHSLTQSEVQQLVDSYSEANLRLHPHVGVRLGS